MTDIVFHDFSLTKFKFHDFPGCMETLQEAFQLTTLQRNSTILFIKLPRQISIYHITKTVYLAIYFYQLPGSWQVIMT